MIKDNYGKFLFHELTEEVRALMLKEIDEDIVNERLFKSSRFNEVGNKIFTDLLIEAIKAGDEETLEIFAQVEFNRYYIRGRCRLCLSQCFNKK